MKYIFFAGAPGSSWSNTIYNVYFSKDIDRSDSGHGRMYQHIVKNRKFPVGNHLGSYFDPGMEFGNWFDKLNEHTKEECEAEFDRPFSGEGIRIIRSHYFSYHLDFLRENWPDCPIVLCHRKNDVNYNEACLGYWVISGHFNIKYPNYQHYKNLDKMYDHIVFQNKGIVAHWNESTEVKTNLELADALGIEQAPKEYFINFNKNGFSVCLI